MIEDLQAEHRERHKLTINDILQEYEENRQAALKAVVPQIAAANGSTTGKAKLLGFFVDKTENKHDVKIDDVKDLTDYELKAELAKIGIIH